MPDVLLSDFLGKPAWMWLGFMTIVVMLLVVDLGILHRESREIGVRESIALSAAYIAMGVAFGGLVWWQLGSATAIDYLTGFAVEKTLAMDNVFVIAMIFGFFAIPRQYQHRVLFWGILGVIVLRAAMIGLGAPIVARFSWVLYLFAVFLILTGIKMLMFGEAAPDLNRNPVLVWMRRHFNVTDELQGDAFFVVRPDPRTQRPVRWITPLFLALVLVEVADLIFAVDSIPAIFLITTDPYIVYTSNIFAILGLRALYFALSALVERFRYLKLALSILLIFIGSKVFVADLFDLEKFPPLVSLGATFGILGTGIAYSLWMTRADPKRRSSA